MKRLPIFSVVIALLFGTMPVTVAAQSGKTCSVIGQISGELVCLAKGKSKVWQKLQTVSAVQSVIEQSLKSSQLPKNLKPALAKVRSDKSFWLDQECAVDFPDVVVPNCVAGDPEGTRVMVVYGDSHASMWMTALDEIARKAGFKIFLFAKLACPLVEVNIWSYQLNRPFEECTQWQQMVLPRIQALKPDLLVVTDQWKPAVIEGKKSDFDTASVWEAEFPKALQRLHSYAKKLVVISNNPSMQQDSVACASKPRANLALCGAGRAQAGNVRINNIEENAANSLGATFIDAVDLACTEYLCPIVIGDKFVYFDQWHFTQTYVKWLTPVIQRALKL